MGVYFEEHSYHGSILCLKFPVFDYSIVRTREPGGHSWCGGTRQASALLSGPIAGRGHYISHWWFLGQVKCAKHTTLWLKYLASPKTKNWDVEALLQLHHSWHHVPVSFYPPEVDRHIWTALGHRAVHCCTGRKIGTLFQAGGESICCLASFLACRTSCNITRDFNTEV